MRIPLQGFQPAAPARIRGGIGQQENGIWMAMAMAIAQDTAEAEGKRREVDVDEG